MIRLQSSVASVVGIALSVFASARAQAASLQPVSNWGASGVPTTVSMYIYVPDKLATNPPILVLNHYCGGTAAAVFGQAQGGGIVKAADQYGFIMVVPQAANTDGSGRCWDVGSTKALTRDGGGDTQAIAQMVKYTLTKYQANADRIYVTGDSSGGMMTEALLALYPDVFKAGSAFAGVPAGCWAAGNPTGSWSGQCAGGQVTHTPEEWGDIVRKMYPAYSGHRPRVQLVHGDADATINYKNHTEAIKEWSNVLGLGTSPTSTSTVTLGTHQATRQRWQNACGYVVLDAFSSIGGDHGPSDALFRAEYVIPFLGLDKTGAVDPEIAQCGTGSGGASGAGGATSVGGGTAKGGATGSGGVTSNGGTPSNSGGATAAGGNSAGGGKSAAGGTTASGGTASGGRVGTSGGAASGGVSNSGGSPGSGGSVSANGGAVELGGNGGTLPGIGGASIGGKGIGGASLATASGGLGTTNTGAIAGQATADGDPSSNSDGCSCAVVGRTNASSRLVALTLGVALLGLRRRRR